MSEEEEYLYIPTITQQKIISLLVIVPSLLSFIGSWIIIRYVIQDKKKTPYRRILLGLSIFDIIQTFSWIASPYIMSSDVINSYVWSFGNHTSCVALATILQSGIGAQLYSACLSFYFLLTIRFGLREQKFAKRIEKVMHFVVITFSLGTSVTGLVTDMYYPVHVGPGCWVSHPPEGDICSNDSCGAEKMAWAFAGFPTLLCVFCVSINNLVLYCHVRSTVIRGQKKAMEMEQRLSAYNKNQATACEEEEDDSIQQSSAVRSSGRSSGQSWGSGRPNSVLRSSDKQWKRVQEVGKQSFLYVGSYYLCFVWTMIKKSLDGQGFDKLEGSGSIFLPLLFLECIFLPLQGFFNCLIFFRPKYLQATMKFGRETRLWCVKRAIFGEKIKPTCRQSSTFSPSQRSNANQQIKSAGELQTDSYSARNSRALSNSNIESIAESANESDQESVQSNPKKRSGKKRQVSHSDDGLGNVSSHSASLIGSIEEGLEISGREAPPDPGSIDSTNSQSNEKSNRVNHTGEIERR